MANEPLLSYSSDPYPIAGESPELRTLLHRLNNQLGIILANAELLENKLAEEPSRARAGQIVASAVDAIGTIQQIRVNGDPPRR